jgi:RNA polymerase sigma-70 factor (ECF subfamily)
MSWEEITPLVERAQAGDRCAFGELVERFQAAVTAMALGKVRDPLEAQELAQEVFVHAMRKIGQLRDPRCFAGWLRQITARMAINRLARRGPVGCGEPELLDALPAATSDPLAELERSEAKVQLHAALRRLKRTDRLTLESFYLRGRNLVQMSEEFEAPIGTIKRRLHVARERLKAVMTGAEAPARPRKSGRKGRGLALAGV